MKSQGPGYRDYEQWYRPETLTDGKREMIANLAKLAGIARPVYVCPTEYLFENVQKSYVPTRLVNDTRPRLGRALLVKRHNGICVRVDGDLNHGRPHVHIDHGTNRHTASYAIDDGTRLAGDLESRWDKSVRQWIASNRPELRQVWDGMRGAGDFSSVVAELKGSDFR